MKVIYFITIDAAVAFEVMQLVDMIALPHHFPELTKGSIIVLLCLSFVTAVFLSWIYDITPGGTTV
jgi:hypothetical protein